ncbi:MAG TPA: metalloregulator ArsR/SmtB family transcription factor [Nakamurella sp.]
MATGHGVTGATTVSVQDAERIARVMSALATASRVRILARLRQEPCSVGDLAQSLEMAQPAVSQQLRILRDLDLISGVRSGRQTLYSVHDSHVAQLLEEALRHIDHLRPAVAIAVPQ